MDFIPSARLSPATIVGHRRPRVVEALLEATATDDIVVMAAPAGAGKTTAAAHLAEVTKSHVVWYRPSANDAKPGALLRHLLIAVAGSSGADVPRGDDADLVVALLESITDRRVLIVLDELESIAGGRDALLALDALFADLPDSVSVLLTTRTMPAINAPLLSVRGRLTQLNPDLLRFRTWEIDELFSSVYGVSLAPYELAELGRRTGGWAAGLQLFHLATERGGDALRSRTLAAMGSRRGPSWDFLARNVVESLRPEHRSFLLDVIGLGRLRPELCDELRGRTDSAILLEEMAAMQLFVTAAVDGDGYLVHEVLGAHLRGRIVNDGGAAELDRRHRQAAQLLDGTGRGDEAFEAYARAGDWEHASLMLRSDAAQGAGHNISWVIDQVPENVLRDPWWTLASARRHRGEGRLHQAADEYERIEANDFSGAAAGIARRERLQLVGFGQANSPTSDRWIGALRDALTLQMSGKMRMETPADLFVACVAEFLGHDPRFSSTLAELERSDLGPGFNVPVSAMAILWKWIAGEGFSIEQARLENDLAYSVDPWIERLGMAVLAMVAGNAKPLEVFRERAAEDNDELGACVASALMRLLNAADGHIDQPEQQLDPYSGVAAWATEAVSMISRRAATRPGVPVDSEQRPTLHASVTIECFGGFRIMVEGAGLDLSPLRPRAREVFRLLASTGGEPMHQDLICTHLWPGEGDSARSKLQTAISSVRRLLSDGRVDAVEVVRTDGTYRLAADDEVPFDVRDFERLVKDGVDLSVEDPGRAAALLGHALECSHSVLIPESGSADWVVAVRESIDRRRIEAALELAGLLAEAGDTLGAARACERGLDSDRYDRGLWSMLIDLTESSGDEAWHAVVVARHGASQAELLDR